MEPLDLGLTSSNVVYLKPIKHKYTTSFRVTLDSFGCIAKDRVVAIDDSIWEQLNARNKVIYIMPAAGRARRTYIFSTMTRDYLMNLSKHNIPVLGL